MARGFRRQGATVRHVRYAAQLDPLERATVAGLMDQVHDLLHPAAGGPRGRRRLRLDRRGARHGGHRGRGGPGGPRRRPPPTATRPSSGCCRPRTGRTTRRPRSSAGSPRRACASARPRRWRRRRSHAGTSDDGCASTTRRRGRSSPRSPTCASFSASGWGCAPTATSRSWRPRQPSTRRPAGLRPGGLRLPHLAPGDLASAMLRGERPALDGRSGAARRPRPQRTAHDVTLMTTCAPWHRRSWPYLKTVADSPIGVFDSGYGGLTVMRAVLDQLPHESVAYFGDTARAPYGPRPIAQTREFALECLDRLVDHGVKILVIACNTASAAVLHDARERYDVPVVEVIRPAVRRPRPRRPTAVASASSRPGHPPVGRLPRCLRRRAAPRRRQHPVPAFRRVRRARCHRWPRARRGGARVPRPAAGPRRRHGRPRLHPLPPAHRGHLLRHGRRRHARLVGRGDGQGRLPRARRRVASCGPTTCRHRTTGSPRPATPRSSGASRAGSSASGPAWDPCSPRSRPS